MEDWMEKLQILCPVTIGCESFNFANNKWNILSKRSLNCPLSKVLFSLCSKWHCTRKVVILEVVKIQIWPKFAPANLCGQKKFLILDFPHFFILRSLFEVKLIFRFLNKNGICPTKSSLSQAVGNGSPYMIHQQPEFRAFSEKQISKIAALVRS